MKKSIKSIIDDLYKIDPSLKKQEKDLEKLVEKLIEAKPDIKMDKVFVKNLRRCLSSKADEMMEKIPKKFGLLNFLYAFGGTAMALVIIVSIFGQNKIGVPMPGGTVEFNINEIAEPARTEVHSGGEAPVKIDIEVAPILKTQQELPVVEPVEDTKANMMIERSIDDIGEDGEEGIGAGGGGSSAAFFDMPMSGAVEATLEEPEIDQYYLDLFEICETRSKPDCCIASIEAMIIGQYLLMTADGCLEGFKMGMLDCGSDIRWCEGE